MSTVGWIQAIDIVASWGLETPIPRIVVELCLGGMGSGMFTTLLSEFRPTGLDVTNGV